MIAKATRRRDHQKNPTRHRTYLFSRFWSKILPNPELSRALVSFQANLRTPIYGWFKYKEGFSAKMVKFLLTQLTDNPGVLLDPFAGSGTALFAARSLGWNTLGIELLPVGLAIADARLAAQQVDLNLLIEAFREVAKVRWEDYYDGNYAYKHIPITAKAFPLSTERALAGYLAYCHKHVSDLRIRRLMRFACMSVLESVSYTRKDGQYLRWDFRSGKGRTESKFHNGKILLFDVAIRAKLQTMLRDIQVARMFNSDLNRPSTELREGSCLELLPQLDPNSIDVIFTSPPYCNRYDYTRTYALELVFLGYGDADIKRLRQSLLSSTVENKTKHDFLYSVYEKAGCTGSLERVEEVFRKQKALHEVLQILDTYRNENHLNNPNIVNMIRNYFYEMCFVVFEFSRVLKPRGMVIMVNDNVRYAGEEVPVDLILSSMAESFGLRTNYIWVLQRGKGNSSQQMGNHGRSELRKCVYVWEKISPSPA